jgi:deoxyribodipyrimidine photo-lyase
MRVDNAEIALFWFRRDLRLADNAGLFAALQSGFKVQPIFIFDSDILDLLSDKADKRVEFIHLALEAMQQQLNSMGATLDVRHGKPLAIFRQLVADYKVKAVYTNHDYEPYAKERDEAVKNWLISQGITFSSHKDQVIFEKDEVLSNTGRPYTVYTPYSRKWREQFSPELAEPYDTEKHFDAWLKQSEKPLPSLEQLGFRATGATFPPGEVKDLLIKQYGEKRNFPAVPGTSRLSVHLRFGTVSIRSLVYKAMKLSDSWWNELIWREFYMQILWHFPHVAHHAFKKEYERIAWRNDEMEFKAWCEGKTGYPIVDAGMRELNATGFMHNRVRMITASFLVKHLLIDWRWGEKYFAQKLLDFDLSANNGGWQWAAGSGCDAAPYFRVFNPALQTEKFDKHFEYIKKWVPEFGTSAYPKPIVQHEFARKRVLEAYKLALQPA